MPVTAFEVEHTCSMNQGGTTSYFVLGLLLKDFLFLFNKYLDREVKNENLRGACCPRSYRAGNR